jgi:4-diphosphocytidyl-2-C-methyl-D-erythritol kinase
VNSGIVVAAPAKINLFLHVGEKRADGYHDLESLAAFAALGDDIRLDHDDRISLSVDGPFAAQLAASDDNLVVRAAKRLSEKSGALRGVRIGLRKTLPVAAGLGGGSADAAAVLRGLVQLWKIDPGREALRDIAGSLGADVPVCIDCRTAWMEGRGDRVRPLPPLPSAGVLLVNPGLPISTTRVFANLQERRGLGMMSPATPFEDVHALVSYLIETTNDLEIPARAIAPVIVNVTREIAGLPDVLLTRMSGSGATCFGVFASKQSARTAALLLRPRHPEWWIADTTFADQTLPLLPSWECENTN